MAERSRSRSNAVTAEAIAERRAEILGHAAESIVRGGVTGCTFAAVSESSGFSIGMIQHYFRTRDRLIDACIDHRIAASEWEWRAIEAGNADPLGRLRDLVAYAVDGEFASGWGFWLELFNASRLDPALREQVGQRLMTWRLIFSDSIAGVVEGGATTTQRPIEDIASGLVGLADGLAMQVINSFYGMTPERMRELLTAYLADELGITI